MATAYKSKEEFRTQKTKNIIYFCNNIYLRYLTGFKYVPEEYLFWKYREIP